jgi:poly-beta-1,6-N-acetyl-D-glucosamine synthase
MLDRRVVLAVALIALAVLAYTYLGYPLLVALAARLWPSPPRRDPGFRPRVSALIPVHNARRYVAAKLDSLLGQDYPGELEILVCSDAADDGSDDEVAAIAARDPRVRLMRLPRRSGKPTAVNAMRRAAGGEVLLMTDVRQPLSPGALSALVAALGDPAVGCASGNLVLTGATGAGVYWRYENWIRRSEGNFRSMVGVTGPLYAVRAADMADLPLDLILDDMWVPMRLRLRGRRIVFCEDAEARDDAFEDDRELGRKIRTLAGNYQLFARLPALLVPLVNPSWFETVSHKLLRLVCPWALVALAVTTGALVAAAPAPHDLASALPWALAGGQLGFYAAAAAGKRAGRLAGVARTFVVLNYAAVAGLVRWLRGAQRVTW